MKSRRLLVLSFYYPPDLSAGSFRAHALVEALGAADPTLEIDVVTTHPNRYGSFASTAPSEEHRGRVRIRRVPLSAHRSGMLDQARAFGEFMRRAARLTRGDAYDLVFATSSRLLTAALARFIAARQGAPLYLDIRDLFVDTMAEVLPGATALVLNPALGRIERWTIRGAAHVNLVSRGFEPYFADRYPATPLSFYTNGVDDEFVDAFVPRMATPHPVIRVLYAGNIGAGQGLDTIVPALARRLHGTVSFTVIGDGGRRAQLERALAEGGGNAVAVRPPMDRASLVSEYQAADVLFLHLNDYEAFRKVLPSKIFEYAALGKPIWAGVAGHAAEFLTREVPNAAVFQPCDVEGAVAALERLEIRDSPRPEFIERFSRRSIMRRMADHVLSFMGRDSSR